MDIIEIPSEPSFEPGSVEQRSDQPRERLARSGSQSLSDAELLALLLGTGIRDRPVLAVAADLVQTIGGVGALSRASPRELGQVSGVGEARAARISAAFELGRRAVELVHHRKTLINAADVYRVVSPRLCGLSQEVVLIIGVDIRNNMLDIVEVARGSVFHVEVGPREVFRPLIRMAAAGGILVHNHPSGDPSPSAADREMTRQLRTIGHMLGLPIVDHVIIGDHGYRSVGEWMGVDF